MANSGRRERWAPLVGSAALALGLVGGGQLLNGWLFGLLLLAAWGLLIYGLRTFTWKRSRQLLVGLTSLVLVVVLWDYTAPQPTVLLDAVQLRKMPSSVQPGLVELIVRNNGSVAADIEVLSVAHLAPLYRSARDLQTANVEATLRDRLKQAAPTAAAPIALETGKTTVVNVEVPFSERAWQFARGELTVLVTARIRYRDRIFPREQLFCQFMNPRSVSWASCPFLNN
jgi:hypothetical protein